MRSSLCVYYVLYYYLCPSDHRYAFDGLPNSAAIARPGKHLIDSLTVSENQVPVEKRSFEQTFFVL